MRCPQGKTARSWRERSDKGEPYIQIVFAKKDCDPCPARSLCTRAKKQSRRLRLQLEPQYEALKEARLHHASPEGKRLYDKRAGVEGTISQGVRAFGLGKHVIGVWSKHICSVLLQQQPSILTDWWPGLMTSQEGKQDLHGLRLWRQFDFANRIRSFSGHQKIVIYAASEVGRFRRVAAH